MHAALAQAAIRRNEAFKRPAIGSAILAMPTMAFSAQDMNFEPMPGLRGMDGGKGVK